MHNKNIIVKYDVFRPFCNSGPKPITLDDIEVESFKRILKDLTDYGIDLMRAAELEPNDNLTRHMFYTAMNSKTERLFEERKISSQKVICDETNNKKGSSLEAVVYVGESIGLDFYGIKFGYAPNVV